MKPSNIILDTSDRPHITDFGLAKRASVSETMMTSEGRVMGTPAYMSPEQALGKATDGRTDVYALALVFFRMITGALPFEGASS